MKKIKYYSVGLITGLFIAGTLTYASSSGFIGSLFEETSTNVFVIKNNAFKANSIHADALQKLSIQTDRIKDYAITSAKLATSLNLPADTKLNGATILTSSNVFRSPEEVKSVSSSAGSPYAYLGSSCPSGYTEIGIGGDLNTVNAYRIRKHGCNRSCGAFHSNCGFKSTCYDPLYSNSATYSRICIARN